MTDAPLDGYVLTEITGTTASIIGRCDPEGGVVPVHGQAPEAPGTCAFDDAWIVAELDAVPVTGKGSTVATYRAAALCTGNFDQAFTESIPLKRWGEVEDVANLAVFLASDESSYIHGDLIKVDGGETLCRYSV